VADEFDVEAMIARFRDRAAAVRRRGVPPVEGDERRRIMEQMQLDYMDFAILGDAEATLEAGVLTLRVDLRPPEARQG
jgi:flagellar motor component MotA